MYILTYGWVKRYEFFSPKDNLQFTWRKISEKCIKILLRSFKKKIVRLTWVGNTNSRACHSSRCCTFSFPIIISQSNSDIKIHIHSPKGISVIQTYPKSHAENDLFNKRENQLHLRPNQPTTEHFPKVFVQRRPKPKGSTVRSNLDTKTDPDVLATEDHSHLVPFCTHCKVWSEF